jgi:hypothetical protein
MCSRCIHSQYTTKAHILCIVAECSIDEHHSKEGSQETEANSPETLKRLPWIDNTIFVAVKEGYMLLQNRESSIVIAWGSTRILCIRCHQCPGDLRIWNAEVVFGNWSLRGDGGPGRHRRQCWIINLLRVRHFQKDATLMQQLQNVNLCAEMKLRK